jgi:predicted dinucleotide-binding enzyme
MKIAILGGTGSIGEGFARKLANLELSLDLDVVVCGDDNEAKKTVMELYNTSDQEPAPS